MPSSFNASEFGATVVITHRIRPGGEAGYETWLDEIGPICKSYPGNLDLQAIRPIPGLTGTSTVIIRFDTHEHLRGWMESDDRKRMIAKIRPLLAKDDEFHVRSGMDFWFTPDGAQAQVPVRWKQFLVTWSALYPVSLGISYLLKPLLGRAGITNHWVVAFFVSGVALWVMVYAVMPRYTRLLRHWLYR